MGNVNGVSTEAALPYTHRNALGGERSDATRVIEQATRL